MDRNRQKEEFSNAFVQAVAATAGFSVVSPPVDDDSIDWQIAQAGGSGTVRSPKLELQLKSTATIEWKDGEDTFPFRLPKKNYEDLRPANVLVPRILVVVRLPEGPERWTEMTDEQLILRHCAYWLSLRGNEESDKMTSVTVYLPTSQRFNVEALQRLMTEIAEGEAP